MTTTTKPVTDELKLTTLKHLASGKDLDMVATIVKLPRETVLDIGSHHGYPDKAKLGWAADILEGKINAPASTLPEKRPERTERATARPPQTAGAATSTPAAPAPAQLTKPDEIRVLLNTAKGHPAKRIQAAADRVFDQLDRIRQLIEEDEEKHAARRKAAAEKEAARAEVKRLEAQLAEAKAKLRPPKPASTTADDETSSEGPSAADVRAWAADKGIDCPARGRVPELIRAAYDKAHETTAESA